MTGWRKQVLLLSLVLLFGTSSHLYAHGGGTPRVINAELGSTVVSVWTQPDPLATGTIHITVALSEAVVNADGRVEPGEPLLNREISLAMLAPDAGAAPVVVPVTHADAANKLLYEADFDVATPGAWQMVLQVADAGEIPFALEIQTASPLNWTVIGGVALVAVVLGWLIWQRRQSAQ
jgi:hypothetical protein